MTHGNKVHWEVKSAVFRRDGFRCRYCKKLLSADASDPLLRPTVDHVVPRSKGGKNTASNLVTCCWDCNNAKGSNETVAFNLSGAARLAQMRRWFP